MAGEAQGLLSHDRKRRISLIPYPRDLGKDIAEEKEEHEEKEGTKGIVKRIGKKKRFIPSANTYRCGALGFHRNMRDKLLVYLCMAAQILGPIFLYDYSHRTQSCAKHETVFTLLVNMSSYCLGNQTDATHFHSSSPIECWWSPDIRKLIEMKLLGALLISMIFVTMDQKIYSQTSDVEYLRRFFCIEDWRSMMWLLADVTCNSLCYLVISFTVGSFLAGEDSVLSIVKDSMALLFLANLDELGGDIGYTTTTSHFDDAVEKAHVKWATREVHRHDYNYVPVECCAAALAESIHRLSSWVHFLSQLVMCCQLAIFVTMVNVDTHKDWGHYLAKDMFEHLENCDYKISPLVFDYWEVWVLPAGVLWLIITSCRICYYCRHQANRNRRSPDTSEVENGFQCDFCDEVVFNQRDARNLYTEALHFDRGEGDERDGMLPIKNNNDMAKVIKDLQEKITVVKDLQKKVEDWQAKDRHNSRATANHSETRGCEASFFKDFGR